VEDTGQGFKYLGFNLNTNDYKKNDWLWLLVKIEKQIHVWCNRWVSLAGRLVLVKSILEAIHVYWSSLVGIRKGILGKIRKLSFIFLWDGCEDKKPMVLAS
jgi:hypothetical protein